ncbi:uncharacterized protein KY384_003630 [Bacidia gigantensis]|uniref:uncharacterized protein n=1 Tax=Bacidia gigantensis TaxID=2732470 RepID=UPI001D0405C8|nr:uncharacterized protein KY384_003630 [Bacidia gigantensis]KAG8531994.1 hypothetical protein KY384_003630 [Bacidia gigantensis]
MPEQNLQGRGGEQDNGLSAKLQTGLQSVAIFFFVQFLFTQFFGKGGNKTVEQGAQPVKVAVPSTVPAWEDRPSEFPENYNPTPQVIAPIWPVNSSLDVAIYISSSVVVGSLSIASRKDLVLNEKNISLGDFEDSRQIDTTLQVPREVQDNGTWWMHVYMALNGKDLDPESRGYDPSQAHYFARPLNEILPKKKVRKTKNLLAGSQNSTSGVEEALDTPRRGSFYHPNLTVAIIPDSGTQSYSSMHPAVRQQIHLESSGARDTSGQNGWYYPILFFNTFWQLRDHMTELNSTVKEHGSWNERKPKKASEGLMPAGGDGSEFEEFKRVLLDTNIYLLATTGIVTVLHMVFEMLAFKSDVSHWRKKKDNVGISVRTILANVFMQTIIFLYLMDNSEGTSWMILLGQGMSILIEAWKITKTVNVRVRPSAPNSWLPYTVAFEDKHKLSETEEKTKEYDEIAFRYLYMIAVPLLGAYAVYSVIYDTHRSWYSFVITTLVGSVYAYGFLMMVPSLYINYRLKSVAHMPARAMTYKFLNTFIDDLFAFTIKMPTLHRLATLRDDVIFFFYLYQSYAYKVDYGRVNEFGQGGDDETVEDKLADKALTAPPSAKGSTIDEKEANGKNLGKSELAGTTGAERGSGSAKKRK